MTTFSNIKKHVLAYLSILTLVLFAYLTLPDYGLAWDEPAQRTIGQTTYNYIEKGDTSLYSFIDNTYGVAFELPLIYLEDVLHLKTTQAVYHMRHGITHLFFLFAGLCFYFLLYRLYTNAWLALSGMLALLLQPVLYAHSFFNSKDIPTLSLFVIAFYLLVEFDKRKNWLMFILLSLATGLLINIRIIGFLFLGVVVFYFFIEALRTKKWIKNSLQASTFVLLSLVFLYVSWPYLWTSPIQHLQLTFEKMAQYPWPGNNLFMGQLSAATAMPWYYLPVWFGISIQPLILLLFLFGGGLLLFRFVFSFQKTVHTSTSLFTALGLLMMTLTMSSILYLHSVLYDGWRHVFFFYPFILLVVVYTLSDGIRLAKTRWLTYGLAVLIVAHAAYSILYLFPHGQVYFNSLVKDKPKNHIRMQYEMDYWGLSNTQAIRYILAHDTAAHIPIEVSSFSGLHAQLILSEQEKSRLDYVNMPKARYFITHYRYHPEDYPEFAGKEFYTIERKNSIICTVFKLK